MSIQKEQPYTPLTKEELKTIQSTLNKNPNTKKLTTRVISQLRNQEHYNDLLRAHQQQIHKDPADTLRDIADDLESLQDKISELEYNQ
jgi:ribosomal protein L2